MNSLNLPFKNLNPNLILAAIESIGFTCSGSLLALNSYENRVYQIGIENAEPIIAKFYRPNRWSDAAILEEHQFAAELNAYEIPIVQPLIINHQSLHHYGEFRFAVYPRCGGRALELDSAEQLAWMGRFMGRMHAIGNCEAFQHRLKLNTQNYGYQPYQFLLENNFIPTDLKKDFNYIIELLLNKITLRFQAIGELNYIRLHGDCHVGNILWHDIQPHIVDLDDCLTGPAIQDIWMLLSSNVESEMRLQLQQILQGYQDFFDFNYREVYLIESLRTLRMIHYAAWLAKRWDDPAFPLNFPWFNTHHYWVELLKNLNDQNSAMDHSWLIEI